MGEQVPAHYLRSNETSGIPRTHIVFDTEAYNRREQTRSVQTFRCAVVASFYRTNRHNPWMEGGPFVFTAPDDMWAAIDEGCATIGRTVVAAHNLGYDLRISQAFRCLPDLGWQLDGLGLERGKSWAVWRRGRQSMTMVDTTSWCPAQLADLAKEVGYVKPNLPSWAASDEAWVQRCTADTLALRAVWRTIVEWLDVSDMGNWRPTGAGQGWQAFRHRWMADRVLVHNWPRARQAEREAMHAGRCEAWRWGPLPRGPWVEYDATSAYAHIARDAQLPSQLRRHFTGKAAQRALDAPEGSRVLAHCDVSTEVPTAPLRASGRVLWPVGRFTSWLWDVECEMVRAFGGTVRARECFAYDAAPVLAQWGSWVLAQLALPDGELHPIVRRVIKGWSRSVVGRFAAQSTEWLDQGPALEEDGTFRWTGMAGSGQVARSMVIRGRQLLESARTDARDSAPAMTSAVMAESRCRLWAAMVVAGLGDVAYVDTDGLLVSAEGAKRLDEAQIPGLRVKSAWRTVRVIGPKRVELEGRLRASGVPKDARQVAPDVYDGVVWRSLGAALALGELDHVVIDDRTWHLTGDDSRRHHLPGGSTAPIRV